MLPYHPHTQGTEYFFFVFFHWVCITSWNEGWHKRWTPEPHTEPQSILGSSVLDFSNWRKPFLEGLVVVV